MPDRTVARRQVGNVSEIHQQHSGMAIFFPSPMMFGFDFFDQNSAHSSGTVPSAPERY
jgi:hypothetical protein